MKVFVTGSAGFIGFHLSKLLLEGGFSVHGYDALTDYYDVNLKKNRHKILDTYKKFSKTIDLLENKEALNNVLLEFKPNVVIHLAAQAGVRYSLENPKSYIDSNIVGTFNLLDSLKQQELDHLLMASTSSVYGANEIMPFKEAQKTDTQLSIYAATKKANEVLAHSYSHVYGIPTTMFRFFTVYGPWGRPDMSLFKFTKGILEKTPIDIFNKGDMFRDLTYVDDLVKGIFHLIEAIPEKKSKKIKEDSLSPVAPFRIVNIGNSEKVPLMKFIEAIEDELGIKAIKNFLPMQTGDVKGTLASNSLLYKLTGFSPQTNYKDGVKEFVRWFRSHYKI